MKAVYFVDVRRMSPKDTRGMKLVRLPINEALEKVHSLLIECFGQLDFRRDNTLRVLREIREANGTMAAQCLVRLDAVCQFFLRFALEIYGLELYYRKL